VLIFVAGTWYLLAMLITGKDLYMARIARLALWVELVVSWTVWSHHLLADQAQPAILKIVSGEFVTAFELITQGLAFFITLITLWRPHVHVAILIGLVMTLYAAIYYLLPILTNGAKLYSQKLANFHFWAHLVGGIGMGAFMGMAGLKGMLRRTIYYEGEYNLYMILAAICGSLLLLAFFAFLYNVIMTLGVKGLIGIFTPSRLKIIVIFLAICTYVHYLCSSNLKESY